MGFRETQIKTCKAVLLVGPRGMCGERKEPGTQRRHVRGWTGEGALQEEEGQEGQSHGPSGVTLGVMGAWGAFKE